MKKISIVIAVAFAVVALSAIAQQFQTKYDYSGAITETALSTAVNFSPAKGGPTLVKAVSGYSQAGADAALRFYARDGSPVYLGVAATTAQKTVFFPSFTSNEFVMVDYGNGNVSWDTLSAVTSSNVTLVTGLSESGTVAVARLFAMDPIAELFMGAATAYAEAGDAIVATPADSPLRVASTGTATNYVTVTVQK